MTKILIILLVIPTYIVIGQPRTSAGENLGKRFTETSIRKMDDCITMPFHYLIVENVLYSPKVRHILVFLDEKAFTEENLKTLFQYLSKKNPEPKHLTITLKTNWTQLSLSSDCPQLGLTNQPARRDEYDYHQAIFYRRDRSGTVEYFRYNPILKTADLKTVVLKGAYPAQVH